MSVAYTGKEIKQFLVMLLDSANFALNRINFDDQSDWRIVSGRLSHKSKGFFSINGLSASTQQQEVLILFQPQSAVTGILICLIDGEIFILVQARIEPGNTGIIQLGPSVQSTPANFLRLHGGKSTAYLDFLYGANDQVKSFHATNHIDLGKLYYQKTKWLNYALIDEPIKTEPGFIWASLKALIDVANDDYLINTDLRSLLAVFDWDSFTYPHLDPIHCNGDILKYLLNQRDHIQCRYQFVDIDKSDSFHITNQSISARYEAGLDIGMYEVKTKYREVNHWIQPLWGAQTMGLALLLCRDHPSGTGYEYLISIKQEIGISGSLSIGPSYLIYPNEEVDPALKQTGETLYHFKQSDEGGRFIKHEYLFRVAKTAADIEVADNQFWLSAQELKQILGLPNLASIQLRNICAVLVEELNPKTFKV